MNSLNAERCSACEKGAPKVSDAEMAQFKPQIPDWQVVEYAGVPHLERVYQFKDFQSALDFTVRVGAEAEAEGHHPALLTEWGSVKVSWWTHTIRGLHKNDLIMAARTDAIAGEMAQ